MFKNSHVYRNVPFHPKSHDEKQAHLQLTWTSKGKSLSSRFSKKTPLTRLFSTTNRFTFFVVLQHLQKHDRWWRQWWWYKQSIFKKQFLYLSDRLFLGIAIGVGVEKLEKLRNLIEIKKICCFLFRIFKQTSHLFEFFTIRSNLHLTWIYIKSLKRFQAKGKVDSSGSWTDNTDPLLV